MIQERLNTYEKDHCWQYDIRVQNMDEDLKEAGITKEYAEALKVTDFVFKMVDDKKERQNLTKFIKRHEWLGNLSQFTTHWFAAYHKDILAGVILMNVPNSFSKLMGENTSELERLISRGACISWSPKNLASAFMMWSIKWMVDNTNYRIFTAYSDPSAKELGTIYQACNFYYIGQSKNDQTYYISPYSKKIVSDRYFRQKTVYRKMAKDMGIEWGKDWNHKTGMNWHNLPEGLEEKLRAYSKKIIKEAEKFQMPAKHKYAYVLGRDKRETKHLRKIYEERNKVLPYPKERGK
jgi:hypothetical protein